MFIQNKYTKTYYNIINRAKSRAIDGYTETHHIIPRSLGGNNNIDNLVKLTAREHFICHLLLPKMTTGANYQKMLYAYTAMSGRNLYNAKKYEFYRKEYTVINSLLRTGAGNGMFGADRSGIKNTFFGKTHSDETKQKISISQKQRKINNPDSFKKGPFSLEHKKNISIARLTRVEKTYNFVHDEHGNFTGTIQDLIKHYPDTFTKKYHNAEIWKLTAGLYKSCKGWKLL